MGLLSFRKSRTSTTKSGGGGDGVLDAHSDGSSHDDNDDSFDSNEGKDHGNNDVKRSESRLRRLFRGRRKRTSQKGKRVEQPPDDYYHEENDEDKDMDEENTSESMDDYHGDQELHGPPPTRPVHGPRSFEPTNLQSKITEVSNESATIATNRRHYKNKPLSSATVPPPARMAAFHGPPRFDWIDIEYAAATKIQSIQRRNFVMDDLEAHGCTTSAIRNAKRRRKAANKSQQHKVTTHGDAPFLFNCCAMGLAFGDATDLTMEDDVAYREYQRKQYEEKVQQQEAHEEQMRAQYLKQHGMMDSLAILDKVEVKD